MSKSKKNIKLPLNCDINIVYEEYINICFLIESGKLGNLREKAIQGDLQNSKYRSLCWSLFLEVLSDTPSGWKGQRALQRSHYDQLKIRFSSNPYDSNINQDDNPLSQDKKSIWNQHFCDLELLSVINQDVVRTFPGVEFFRKPKIQEMITNVLFVFAREHPDLVYLQGFHEILAIILFVVHCDQQAFQHIRTIRSIQDPDLAYLLNPEYLEADSYMLFMKVMDKIKCYYRVSDMYPLPTGHFPNYSESVDIFYDSKKPDEHEVIKQLETIKSKLLLKEDLHLHNHLLRHEIPLSLFGIRWLRLLFGREFSLDDLLIVWDAIFATDKNFELVNYLCVAMLIRIRDKLLYSDYTTTLMYLMRYPSDVDVTLIIRHALHMYAPEKYHRPEGIFVYTANQRLPSKLLKQRDKLLPNNNQLSHRQKKSKKVASERIQVQTTKTVLTKASDAPKIDTDTQVFDGYAENDPENFKLELQHANHIMEISRNKLLGYVHTLRINLPHSSNDHVYNAVDGIEELCLLLQPKHTAVEKAFEAEESIIKHNASKPVIQRQPSFTFLNAHRILPPIQELKQLNNINNKVNLENLPKIDPTMERRDSI